MPTEIRYDAAMINDAAKNFGAKKYEINSFEDIQKNMGQDEKFVAILYSGNGNDVVVNVSKQADYAACMTQAPQFEKVETYKIGKEMLAKCKAPKSKTAAMTYDAN